jgi:hypothetical protein
MEFQRRVSQIARDVAVIWNPERCRYQVFQVESKGLVDATGKMKYRPHLIFTVQNKDGSFRPLGVDTIKMIAKSVELGHEFEKYTPEEYMAKLEKYEDDILQKQKRALRQERLAELKDLNRFHLGKRKTFLMS